MGAPVIHPCRRRRKSKAVLLTNYGVGLASSDNFAVHLPQQSGESKAAPG
jgi:hypothetical protein